MLDVVDRWCKKWKIAINQGKTKVLHFRPNSVIRSRYSFKCGDINVEYDTKYRYLGLRINDNLDFRYTVKEIAKSASRALSALYTKHLSCGGFSYEVYTKLYRSMVEPVLYYGASICGQSEWKEINTVQNKACRYFLGSAKNSSNLATRGDMGFYSCHTNQMIEVLRYYFRICNYSDNRIPFVINERSENITNSWHHRVKKMSEKYNLVDILNSNENANAKLVLIKEKLFDIDNQKWWSEVHNDRNNENGNKLRTYRQYKYVLSCSSYVKNVKNRIFRRTLSNFRSGSLKLAIETGGYAKPKIPLENRLCIFCDGSHIETETHFFYYIVIFILISEDIFLAKLTKFVGILII